MRPLLHHLHPTLAVLVLEMPGARVDRFVVVVVGVDGPVGEVHGGSVRGLPRHAAPKHHNLSVSAVHPVSVRSLGAS